MSIKGLIFWGLLAAFGVAGLATVGEADTDILTLEHGLGANVETTRL